MEWCIVTNNWSFYWTRHIQTPDLQDNVDLINEKQAELVEMEDNINLRWVPGKNRSMKSVRIRSFWSVFSRIWTEHGDLWSKSLYSVRIRENTDQKNSKYGHFSCSEAFYASRNKTKY